MLTARAAAEPPLLDAVMPVFDFGHCYARDVAAPPARVFAAAESFRLARDGSFAVHWLIRLRGLGAPQDRAMRDAFTSEGFTVIAERPGEEVVFAVAGRFWALDERAHLVSVRDAGAFAAYAEPGGAKAAMSLRVEPRPDGTTRLVTETRVACVDAAARWRFRLYWLVIEPFSIWIRRDMLRAIARRACAGAAV